QRPLKHLNEFFLERSDSALVIGTMVPRHKLILDLRSLTEFRSYYTGRYDADRIRLLLRLIPRNSIVLDIGANIGFYAVPLALHVRQHGGFLHAFEPVPTNANRLQDNLILNHLAGHVRLHRVGLSS